jgi:signal peptide peptidase-like protein 3
MDGMCGCQSISLLFSSTALGMAMCVAFIALVRLPSLKVSTVLLSGLLLYDVFWVRFNFCTKKLIFFVQVFFSSYIFNANVMVRVATRPADNPIGAFAKRLQTMGVLNVEPPKLSLPAKLVFPSTTGHLTMLGLGDVVSTVTVVVELPFLWF